MVAGALLLLGSVAYWRYAAAVADPGEVRVPVMLAGQALAQQRQGVEAVAEVSRLHGKDFPLVSGAMAVYGNGAATVGVSGAPARLMAPKSCTWCCSSMRHRRCCTIGNSTAPGNWPARSD